MLKRENIGLLILIIIVLIMFSGYIELETLPVAGVVFLISVIWFVVVIMKELLEKSRQLDDEVFRIKRNWKTKINTFSWLGLTCLVVLIILSSVKLYLLLGSSEVIEMLSNRSNIRKLLLLGMLIYVLTRILNSSFRKDYFLNLEDGNMAIYEGGELLFQIHQNDDEDFSLDGNELQITNPTNKETIALKYIKINTEQFHSLQNWITNWNTGN